jgi:hypothetical protein
LYATGDELALDGGGIAGGTMRRGGTGGGVLIGPSLPTDVLDLPV